MKKRILFIMTALNGGGAEKVLVDILHHFDYNQYDVELMLTTTDGVHYKRIPANIKQIILYKILFLQWIRRLFLWIYRKIGSVFLLRFYLQAITKGMEYDTIVSFMEGEPLLIHSLLLNKGKRHVTWVHTDFQVNHWSNRLLRDELYMYSCIDRIVCVSGLVRSNFVQCYPMLAEKVDVVYNLIDRLYIQSLQKDKKLMKKRFTICSVGRLMQPKRYDRLIRVASILKKNNCNVDIWIVGDGALENDLRKLVIELNVTDMVFFMGFQNPPYVYMKQADLFVSTSEVEGFPLVICEAMCIGMPIVATDTCGAKELLGNNEYGIITKHDEYDIASIIMALLNKPEKLSYYRERAMKRANIFDIDETMYNIYKIINNEKYA